MKIAINRLLPILFAGIFVHAGCAKQEVVKNDEPLAPAVTRPAETAPAKSVVRLSPTQDKPGTATGLNATSPESSEQKTSQQPTEPVTRRDIRTSLETIYFDFDAAVLNAVARQALTKNFESLKKSPQARIRIEGHCDERGSDEYNLALGERRAQAAVRFLTTLGIPAERLSTISYGKEKPADPGHDEAAWARNRRDEFAVSN